MRFAGLDVQEKETEAVILDAESPVLFRQRIAVARHHIGPDFEVALKNCIHSILHHERLRQKREVGGMAPGSWMTMLSRMTNVLRQGHCLRNWVFIVVGLQTASCAHRATIPTPQDLATLLAARDYEGVIRLGEHRLQQNLGSRFPDLLLTRDDGTTFSLTELQGKHIAVFDAGGPCPRTIAWIDELKKDGWQIPGYELITIVKTRRSPELELALHGREKVYLSPWPLPSFLTYVRFYPAMFFVGPDSTFVGYQVYAQQPVFVDGTGGDK